jgi:hypothetical protein
LPYEPAIRADHRQFHELSSGMIVGSQGIVIPPMPMRQALYANE